MEKQWMLLRASTVFVKSVHCFYKNPLGGLFWVGIILDTDTGLCVKRYRFFSFEESVISPAKSEFISSLISSWLNPFPNKNINLVTAASGVLS